MIIKFLGTGTSIGVPEIGCKCAVCTSNDERDRRRRVSLWVNEGEKNVLVDCSPDFREQVMRQDFVKIDAVLLSHEHYDHTGGLDDLRPFCRFGEVDIFSNKRVCQAIETRMPYCFAEAKYPGSPSLALHEFPEKPLQIGTIKIEKIHAFHGKLPILGFRINNMAFLTDVTAIEEAEFKKLRGLEVLILDALRPTPHPSHLSIEQALALIEKIGAKKNYLIHMSHQFGLHAEVEKTLPDNVFVSYDFLSLEI